MGSFKLARLSAIFAMLEECAPGHTVKPQTHNYCVRYQGLTFPALPKGRHGAKDPEIQMGHVRQMIRQLQLDLDCVTKHFPDLG